MHWADSRWWSRIWWQCGKSILHLPNLALFFAPFEAGNFGDEDENENEDGNHKLPFFNKLL